MRIVNGGWAWKGLRQVMSVEPPVKEAERRMPLVCNDPVCLPDTPPADSSTADDNRELGGLSDKCYGLQVCPWNVRVLRRDILVWFVDPTGYIARRGNHIRDVNEFLDGRLGFVTLVPRSTMRLDGTIHLSR